MPEMNDSNDHYHYRWRQSAITLQHDIEEILSNRITSFEFQPLNMYFVERMMGINPCPS